MRAVRAMGALALMGVTSELVSCPAAARAHEKWFYDSGPYPTYGVMGILLIWTAREADTRLWLRGVLGSERAARPADPSSGTGPTSGRAAA